MHARIHDRRLNPVRRQRQLFRLSNAQTDRRLSVECSSSFCPTVAVANETTPPGLSCFSSSLETDARTLHTRATLVQIVVVYGRIKSERHRGGPEITPPATRSFSHFFSPFFFASAPTITARCRLRNVFVPEFHRPS